MNSGCLTPTLACLESEHNVDCARQAAVIQHSATQENADGENKKQGDHSPGKPQKFRLNQSSQGRLYPAS